MKIVVHPRVHERHPELSDEDVVNAYQAAIASAYRDDEAWIVLGLDAKGRTVEMIGRFIRRDLFLIYHAMTTPTKKIMNEIRRMGGLI